MLDNAYLLIPVAGLLSNIDSAPSVKAIGLVTLIKLFNNVDWVVLETFSIGNSFTAVEKFNENFVKAKTFKQSSTKYLFLFLYKETNPLKSNLIYYVKITEENFYQGLVELRKPYL